MDNNLRRGILFFCILFLMFISIFFFKINGNSIINIPQIIQENESNFTIFCQIINSSGNYALTQDVLNENYTSSNCFNITASDVEIDCLNYSVINSTASESAFYAENVNNITIKNCMISTSILDGKGIYFVGVNNSFLLNNQINSTNNAISLINSAGISISDNIFDSNEITIKIEGGRDNGIMDNLILFSSSRAINLNSTSNTTLTNNTLRSGNVGIYLDHSDRNYLFNNSLENCSSIDKACLLILGSSYNLFVGGLISSTFEALSISKDGEVSSSNNSIRDIILHSQNGLDINVSNSYNINNSFINTSYNLSNEFVYPGSEIIRIFHYKLFVNSTYRNSGISNVNVTIYNYSSSLLGSFITTDGYTPLISLEGYRNNGSRNYDNIYNVSASNRTSYTSYLVNISQNKYDDRLSFTISAVVLPTVNNTQSTTQTSTEEDEEETIIATEEVATENDEVEEDEESIVINLSSSDIEGGYEVEIDVGDEIYINISEDIHSIILNSFEKNPENSSVNITVSSDPINFILAMGEQYKIDFELDGFYDLLVGFENITFDDKAILLLTKLNESVIKEVSVPEVGAVVSDIQTNDVKFGFLGSIERKVNSPIIGPITTLHFIIGIITISLLMGIIAFIVNRKGNSKLKSLKKKK